MVDWLFASHCIPQRGIVVIDHSFELSKLRIVVDQKRVHSDKTEFLQICSMASIPVCHANHLLHPVGALSLAWLMFHSVTNNYYR